MCSMRKEDRAYYDGDYALIPDAVMCAAVSAGLGASGLYILARMLRYTNNAGEMLPVSFKSVNEQSCRRIDKSAFSRANKRLRDNRIIEPMTRRLKNEDAKEGEDEFIKVVDQSNFGHACSYRIAPELWENVKVDNRINTEKAEAATVDDRGVYRCGYTPPKYSKNTYTAVPFPVLLAARKRGILPQAALTLTALMRNVDWYGRLYYSVDWISANFGLKRVNVHNGIKHLAKAKIVAPIIIGQSHEALKIDKEIWGLVRLDEERRREGEDSILLPAFENAPLHLRS